MSDSMQPTPFAWLDSDGTRWRNHGPDTDGLFEPLEPFVVTWPSSGFVSDGVAYALPTWEPHMAGGGSSSLLPTPSASLSSSGPDYARAGRDGSGGDDLITAVAKLG